MEAGSYILLDEVFNAQFAMAADQVISSLAGLPHLISSCKYNPT
jgi:hypothetical protein